MKSNELISVVDIPKSLLNKRVELIILPVDDGMRKKTHNNSVYGVLKKYANPALIASENSAWATASKEKHALR